jgi:hypothetical protein
MGTTIGTVNVRAATAGATAALVWGLQEPLDQRVFRCDYSDIALLGKAVSRGRWRVAGFAIHALNGAAFGLGWAVLARRRSVSPVALAVAENVVLWPLCGLLDRYHPARGEPGIPALSANPRAFAQATWRHLLFGWLLGRLAG